MAVTGMYLPGSLSNSYVVNKRTETGGYLYDEAENQIGLQEQAALQSLKNDYSTTISNAYSSYLSSQRGIMGSAMGQGYKEAYIENQRQALMDSINNANLNLTNYRQQITENANTMRDQLTNQFQTEVLYTDRLTRSLDDYLAYVKTLTNAKDQSGYLTPDQLTMADEGTELLYDALFNAQPKGSTNYTTGENEGYFDPEGNAGMAYIDWLYKNTDPESDYARWLFGQGGYNNTMNQLISQSKEAQSKYQNRQEAINTKDKEKFDQESFKAKDVTIKDRKDVEQYGITEGVQYDLNGAIYEDIGDGGSDIHGRDTDLQNEINTYFNKYTKHDPEVGDIINYNGKYYIYHQHSQPYDDRKYWAPLKQVTSATTFSKENYDYLKRQIENPKYLESLDPSDRQYLEDLWNKVKNQYKD